MIPLLLADPLSDDRGLEYAYPRAALYAESGFADLTGFEALEREGQLVLRLRLARYPNPQQAPNGFSLAVVAVSRAVVLPRLHRTVGNRCCC